LAVVVVIGARNGASINIWTLRLYEALIGETEWSAQNVVRSIVAVGSCLLSFVSVVEFFSRRESKRKSAQTTQL